MKVYDPYNDSSAYRSSMWVWDGDYWLRFIGFLYALFLISPEGPSNHLRALAQLIIQLRVWVCAPWNGCPSKQETTCQQFHHLVSPVWCFHDIEHNRISSYWSLQKHHSNVAELGCVLDKFRSFSPLFPEIMHFGMLEFHELEGFLCTKCKSKGNFEPMVLHEVLQDLNTN